MINTKEYIDKVRKKTGLSDYKVAKEYNINQSNFSKYSSGKSALSETHAFLIANILNLEPIEVLINTRIEHANKNKNIEKGKFWLKQQKNIKPIYREQKIIISQFNPIVGAINDNTDRLIKQILIAKAANNDLIIFPELAICGYPPEDLLNHNGFIEKINIKLHEIALYAENIIVIVGAPNIENNNLYNSAFIFKDKKIYGIYNKHYLPNYGVFDEKRYFKPGNKLFIFPLNNKIFSVAICEDSWHEDFIKKNSDLGVDTIISINASPFYQGKYLIKLEYFTKIAKKYNVNIIYVNATGAQDGIVFDGASFVINNDGIISNKLPFFNDNLYSTTSKINNNYNSIEVTYKALVVGLKEYIYKNPCFNNKIIIALSGGIDSALTLSIAIDAVGRENILAVMMPSKYTSINSLKDAREQAKINKIAYKEIIINDIIDNLTTIITNADIDIINNIAAENIQARIRANIVMAIANKQQKILLATSNKSEIAVGYTTLYGDMAGGYAPIKDVYKTLVYKLAKYRNNVGLVIPENILYKEPTAELSSNQLDSDTLPPYNILDKILQLFIEENNSIEQIINSGFDKNIVKKVIKMVTSSEYKRNQSAIGTKITKKSFDKERRYPITNFYDFK